MARAQESRLHRKNDPEPALGIVRLDRGTKAVGKFRKKMSKKVFDKEKVEVHLCDQTFHTEKVVD